MPKESLNLVDVVTDALQRFGGVGQRQQVVEEAGVVSRPSQVLGELRRLVTGYEALEPREMFPVQGAGTADRQAHTV